MTCYENILQEITDAGIEVKENIPFESRSAALVKGNKIALNITLKTSVEKRCVLAEEYAHYQISNTNIIDMRSLNNRKEERKARLLTYNKLIGLIGIVNCYKNGCKNTHEMAEYLEVTEKFLVEALECYKNKYGMCAYADNYVVYFEPTLGVLERI